MSLTKDLKLRVLEYIKQPIPQNKNMPIMERSIPIPFFGNIEKARVATISLNPSNLEFENRSGLLRNNEKRFADREILGAKDTTPLDGAQAQQVYHSLINYFYNNPYRMWFDFLEKYVGKMLNCSYYDGTMVNLDIYPWATQEKWAYLDQKEKKLASQNYHLLKEILLDKDRPFDYIYINGNGVKKQIEKYFDICIKETPITNTQNSYNRLRFMYQYTLPNKTKLIGSSCYVQNSYETSDFLTELHEILSQNI